MSGKNRAKFAYYFDVLLVSLVIGLLLFILTFWGINHSFIGVDNKLSVHGLANTLLALIVAIFLPKSLWKILENKKVAKWLLVWKCTRILDESEKLLQLVEGIKKKSISKEINEITSVVIPSLGNKIKSLKDNLSKEFSNFDSEKLEDSFVQFRSAVTDDLRVKGFTFSVSYKSGVRRAFHIFELELENTQFEVNSL